MQLTGVDLKVEFSYHDEVLVLKIFYSLLSSFASFTFTTIKDTCTLVLMLFF